MAFIKTSCTHEIEHPILRFVSTVLRNDELGEMFDGDGSFTVFAPTDEAFEKLRQRDPELIQRGLACLTSLLYKILMHFVFCFILFQGGLRVIYDFQREWEIFFAEPAGVS